MSNLSQTIATTIRHLTNVNSEGPASFDDLVALNNARECINQLFSDFVDELGTDPAATPLWTAIASALELSAPVPSRKPYGSQSAAAQGSRADTRVVKFWDTFADQFAWDLLPTGFLHALYGHWMAERFPREATPVQDRVHQAREGRRHRLRQVELQQVTSGLADGRRRASGQAGSALVSRRLGRCHLRPAPRRRAKLSQGALLAQTVE